jgi:replicative DNA helicase
MITRRKSQLGEPATSPIDRNAVESLLGCVLTFPDTFDAVATIVRPDDFLNGDDRAIFSAAKSLHDAGEPVVAISIAQKLGGLLEEIGGTQRLLQLMDMGTLPQHAEYVARLVRADADRVRLMESSTVTMLEAGDRSREVGDVIVGARRRLDTIEDGARIADEPVSMATSVPAFLGSLADKTPPKSVPTGYTDLDRLTSGGFRDGELIVLAARPGMGKSAYAGNTGGKAADSGVPTLIFSLEQPRDEVLARMLSSVSRVSHERIRKHELSEMDEFALSGAGERMSHWPLWIEDTARRTMEQIAAVSRRHQRRHGLGLVIVDYLQLIAPTDSKVHREQQVATISRSLKVLARDDLKVPVIVLAQLNREMEKRDDKRPRLSDLRESGAIEQDADMVLFIDRPSEYDPKAMPSDATLYLRKNRHGERGEVPLCWKADTLTFMPIHASDSF